MVRDFTRGFLLGLRNKDMNKLKVNLENCYGIKKLDHEFDFSKHNTFVIYAQNGVMKTSFAKTLKVLAEGKEKPCDQINPTLVSKYDFFVNDSHTQIDPKEICVIEPYNENAFNSEDKILTLLSDEETRKEYLKIYNEIENLKKTTLPALKKISGSSNYESEIIESFAHLNKKNIFEILDAILDEVKSSKDEIDFSYNHVFDPAGKVRIFLEDNKKLLEKYIEKYNTLITQSDFFSKSEKNVFGTTEAGILNKALDGDDYFSAGHAIKLKEHGIIQSQKDLSNIVDEEVDKIFNDKDLKDIFKEIEKALGANKELRAFKKVIETKKGIIPRLDNYDSFRRDVWFSFLKQIEKNIESLVDLYNKKKPKIEEIIKKANSGKSEWKEVIEEFENRFINMPFKIQIENIEDAILKEETPVLNFNFQGKSVERKKLVENILSQGEKRAFYLLNIIFEVRARLLNNQKTLFIIDDIADSFDYKNKYAIIEYLQDIAQEPSFYSIILTHNFDFYRTITGRLFLEREHRLHALKTDNEIKIVKEVYQGLPFKTWRECMKEGDYYDQKYSAIDAKKHIIALIPFVRNLIEYSGVDDSSAEHGSDSSVLTSLLHSKEETKKITFADLKLIYGRHINKDDFDQSIKDSNVVYEEIMNLASSIDDHDFNLENKIILAMAIRHKAEEYMWEKVSDKSSITGCQTGTLFDRYKNEFLTKQDHAKALITLGNVNIMTPENIHINSFMYEPILDMGVDELKKLYTDVCQLK